MKGFKLNMHSVKNMVKASAKFMEKNAPAICAGVAIAGLVGSVVAAIKAGPEVKKALEEAAIKKNEQALKERMQEGKDDTPIEDLTLKEKAPIYFKYFWKTGLLVLVSATCMIASVRFGNKQIRTMAVLAAAAESNLTNFEGAAKDLLGEKKFEELKNKVIDNDMEKSGNMDVQEEFVVKTNRGTTLCYEPWFRTYFRMSIEDVKLAVADIEKQYVSNCEVCYDDIYETFKIAAPLNIEETIKRFNNGQDQDLLKDFGYFRDPDGDASDYAPEFMPYSKVVRVNGVEETCYVVCFNRPKSRFEYEHDVEKSFRRKNK